VSERSGGGGRARQKNEKQLTHFDRRLGIGVNYGIFQSEAYLLPFLLNSEKKFDDYENTVSTMNEQLERVQNKYIFWESYCNFIVYGDELFERTTNDSNPYREITEMSEELIQKHCELNRN